jgi:hypothetical protein
MTKTKEKYYKVINKRGTGGFTPFVWPLPKNKEPSDWVTVKGKIVLCENGLHLTTLQSLWRWFRPGSNVYEAEGKGRRAAGDDKTAFQSARLLKKVSISRVFNEFLTSEAGLVLVAQDPRCPPKKLEELAANPTVGRRVVCAVAANPKTPSRCLHKLANSPEESVRVAVCSNTAASTYLLKKLRASNSSSWVSREASYYLAERKVNAKKKR